MADEIIPPDEATASPAPDDTGKSADQIAKEVWEERDKKPAKGSKVTKPAVEPVTDAEGTTDADSAASDAPEPKKAKKTDDGSDPPPDGTIDGHDTAYWKHQADAHQAGFTRTSQQLAEAKEVGTEKDRTIEELRAVVSAHEATAKEFGSDAEATTAVNEAVAATKTKQDAATAKAKDDAKTAAEAQTQQGDLAVNYLDKRHGQDWRSIPKDPHYKAWSATQDPGLIKAAGKYDPYALDLIIRDFKAFKATLKRGAKPPEEKPAGDPPNKNGAKGPPVGGERPGKVATRDGESDSTDDIWDRTPEEHKRITEKATRKLAAGRR